MDKKSDKKPLEPAGLEGLPSCPQELEEGAQSNPNFQLLNMLTNVICIIERIISK